MISDLAALIVAAEKALGDGDKEAARDALLRAVEILPSRPELWANLSGTQLETGDPRSAEFSALRAVALDPANAGAWNNLGNVRLEDRRFDRALGDYAWARRLDPLHEEACLNEAGLLLDLGRFAEGIAQCRRAIAITPGRFGGYNNLGNGEYCAGRLDAAERAFRRALLLEPEDAQTHFNFASPLLKQGRMAEGWAEYEWRRRTPAALIRRRNFDPPEWQGGDPKGLTLMLSTEQGYGDAIQFCRFVPFLAERGARVLVRTQEALVRLMRSLPGAGAVVAMDDPLPEFDYHLPMMSIPWRCAIEAPPAEPYLFADSEPWRQRLGAFAGRKIGLVWSGDPRPQQRTAHLLDMRRSLRLADFAGLPDAHWISLQKGEPARQSPPAGMSLIDWTEELADFADTAALIGALDLVLTVDTSVAHLAGALGKPVWILSRFDGCWRWLEGRDDSPWYPTARLFRQNAPGDWSAPLERVRIALSI